MFGAALRTTAVDVHRTDAAALATKELAALRRTPSLATGTTGPTGALVNAQAYRVTDTVGPATSSGGQAQAYKQVMVSVAWTDQGGSHTLTQSSAVYPGAALVTTPTTVSGCPPPQGASSVTASSPGTGDPAVDVSWVEPTPTAAPTVRWAVQVSPDGSTWATAVAEEQPLPPGATHVVEVAGLEPLDAYAVRVVAYAACGDPVTSPPAVSTAPTAGLSGPEPPCSLASVSLAGPVASRTPTGALAADLPIIVTATSACRSGLWAGVFSSAGTTSVAQLSPGPAGAYTGSLGATASPWDLGRHTIGIYADPVVPGPLPVTPLATADLCVEAAGTATC